MKRIVTLSVFCLVLAAGPAAFADIARPKPQPSKEVVPKHLMSTSLEIVPDAKTYSAARLQLTESTLKELREAINQGTTSQSFPDRVIRSRANTIVAGMLLFLSISFGGIWLVRSSGTTSRGQKMIAGALIGIATLGAATIITQANAGPPPSYFWRSLQKNLSAGKPTSGGLTIELVPEGQGMKLILPVRNGANGDD
jgi:hypothetical protein